MNPIPVIPPSRQATVISSQPGQPQRINPLISKNEPPKDEVPVIPGNSRSRTKPVIPK